MLTQRQKQTFARRLNKLALHLRSLPKGAYYHGAYVQQHDPKHPCGTVACALGHATIAAPKLFRGLRLRWNASTDRFRFVGPSSESHDIDNLADEYFGPATYNSCFSTYAHPPSACKNEVVKSLRQHAKNILSGAVG